MDMQLNLGQFMPEIGRASQIDASARQPGLGLTPSAPASPLAAAPQAMQQPMPQPQQQQPLIDPKQNPFGAMGLVLSSAAAGMRGGASPVAQLQEQRLKQQEMQFKQAELAQNVIERYAPIVMNDPQHADEIIAHGKQIFQGALGNMDVGPLIKAMAASGAEKFKATMAALKEVNPSPAMLQYWSRNPASAMKTLDEYNVEKAKALAKPGESKVVQEGGTLVDDKGNKLYTAPPRSDVKSPEAEAQAIRIMNAEAAGRQAVQDKSLGTEIPEVDPESKSLTDAAGISVPAFMALTNPQRLPRGQERTVAFNEAQKAAKRLGIDMSTFQSRYTAYNDTLQSNIKRVNQTQIMAEEMQGTIENLKPAADAVKAGKLRLANVAKVWAGQETNDPAANAYAIQLNQLREELAGYFAAISGRGPGSGNAGVRVQDERQAERLIKDGLSAGGAEGYATAVQASLDKMRGVLERNTDKAGKAVWGLFGVGDNYKPQYTPEAKAEAVKKAGDDAIDAAMAKYPPKKP